MLKSTDLLRQAVKERGITMGALAKLAHIPRTTLLKRLANSDSFSIGTLRDIFDALSADADEALTITAALLWKEGETNG